MNPIIDLQKQIAYTLIDKIQKNEITTDLATEIALKVERLLPDFLIDKQLDEVFKRITEIPALSSVKLNLDK